MQPKEKDNFKVDFIGIGAMKAVTTWIAKCLAQHPQICFSHLKEPDYFCGQYGRGLKYYQACFKHCKRGQIKGEFSVCCLHSSYVNQAVERIKAHNPTIKLIASLRNPIERAQSYYFHQRSKRGYVSLLTFEESIEKDNELLLLEPGLYYKNLKKYYRHFPKENILILIYEDIKQNPKETIQEIYRFLGVDENFVPSALTQRINPTVEKLVRFPIYNQILALFVRGATQQNANPFLSSLYKILKRIGIPKITGFLRKLNRKKTGKLTRIEKPPMNPETKENLRNFYCRDIEKLEKLLGRDLSFWK